jgi:hypothetical protein
VFWFEGVGEIIWLVFWFKGVEEIIWLMLWFEGVGEIIWLVFWFEGVGEIIWLVLWFEGVEEIIWLVLYKKKNSHFLTPSRDITLQILDEYDGLNLLRNQDVIVFTSKNSPNQNRVQNGNF